MPTPATAVSSRRRDVLGPDGLPLLESGDRLDQRTFHALYERTPGGFKAELVGGVVYVASPTSSRHGFPHARCIHWLSAYRDETPGTEVADNTSNVLGNESEPQPDGFLIVLPKYGGQTTIDRKGYVHGPPELVAEVANSSVSIDLGAKRADYEKGKVREYVVFLVREQRVVWFVRRPDGFAELAPGPGGLLRSEVFPGLWLDPAGFFAPTTRRLMAALRRGLASPEHLAFAESLKARRASKRKPKPKE